MRILLAEDDDLMGSGLEVALRNAGFTVDWARDGLHAQVSLATTHYALLILDLGLPTVSGLDLLKSLRHRDDAIPVLVLTAKGTSADKVLGLDAGADDYLGKPFDLAEFVSRCRALIRRSQGRGSDLIRWRSLIVDPVERTVSREGMPVPVTAREWAVLIHLFSHQGQPQPRVRIAESIYGWQDEIESNAIEVHVSSLRKKLGGEVIRTVRGFGYVVDKS
ncbi:DNA-binding response regulator [Paraburkholderia steynii]|uniref:DNA-binding response regulator n=1 Tax=Paraburkholderia steynii TaxID=1245441 RepID=A0A4R0XAN5_9BURK|nr:DNA-binding response regulator [Paraburkholderia steynii]